MTSIRESGLVDLLLPGSDRRAARVKAIGHGHVLLTVFGAPAGPELDAPSTAATLELVGARGVDRVEGTVALGADPRALTFEPTDPSVLPQRRSAPRVAVHRELVLARAAAGSATGQVVDLSSGGLRFRSAAAFAVGQEVDVTFASGGDGDADALRGPGRILRRHGPDEYAIEFAPWRRAARQRLLALIEGAAHRP